MFIQKKGRILITLMIAALLTLVFVSCAAAEDAKKENDPVSTSVKGLGDGLYAVIDTSKGEIIIKLAPESAPITVANFVGLAEGTISTTTLGDNVKYYDGLTFHRVVDNFVIQGGCPLGNGTGGPGYTIPNEIDSNLSHKQGVISMANAGPHTNGSQFYITLSPQPHLNGSYTIFGEVVKDGMEVVQAIAQGDRINTIKIERIGAKAEAYKVDQKKFEEMRDNAYEEMEAAERKKQEGQLNEIRSKWPNMTESADGIFYEILKEGSGPLAQTGQKAHVHYAGMLLDGTEFDSSYRRGQPYPVVVNGKQVIPGWDLTLLEMKVGEKRRIVLPPNLAYGDRGAGNVIPPNAFLVFEMELVELEDMTAE